MTDEEVLAMLARAEHAPFILLDGATLRSPALREAASVALLRGWIDLGDLVKGDQWAWYEARITDTGRAAINLGRARAAYHDERWPERRCDRCGTRYTGPAVYCSLECAQAEAS